MIIDKFVKVIKNGATNKYYSDKGYIIKDEFEVDVNDLKNSSLVLVNVMCDVCSSTTYIAYYDYNRNIKKHNFYTCKKCNYKKRESSGLKHTKISFIEKALNIHIDKYNYDNIIYINNKTKIKIFCNKCKTFFEQRPDSHLKGTNCPCYGPQKMTTERFIYESNIIHENEYDYSLIEYINSKDKINIICKKHGEFYQNPYNHLSGQKCPLCKNLSKGEEKVIKILKKYNINYIHQKKFDDCVDKRKLPFDFYLTDYNICIEYDGKQHDIMSDSIYSIYDYETIKKHDDIKNQYCIDKNIKLIRISYKCYNKIEEILIDANNIN